MRLQEYFGEDIFDKYGFTLYNKIKGRTISKRKSDDDSIDGLKNVASTLGVDMWDLLEYLEALCHLGFAREIDDSHYRISTKDVENDTLKESFAIQHINGGWVSKYYTVTGYKSRAAKFNTKEEAEKFISDNGEDTNWNKYYIIVNLEDESLSEEYNINDENINIGDYVKVNYPKARAIKFGTIFKVVDIRTESYGGQEEIVDGNKIYHRYIPGWNNETTYVYKSINPRERINIDYVTKATQREIDDATILVTPKENELEIGDRISFEGTVELVNSNEKYNTYKFTDNENGKIYWAFIKANINCTEGAFNAEIIDIQEKYGRQKIRIGKISETACHTVTI